MLNILGISSTQVEKDNSTPGQIEHQENLENTEN